MMLHQYLHIFSTYLLYFLIGNSSAVSQSRFTHIQGQRLLDQILATAVAFSPARCYISCVRHPECRAVNYRSASGECELSGETHVRFVSNVAVDEAWTIWLIPGPCDATWVYYGTSCYWFEPVKKNMTESAKFCNNLGALLLEVHDLQETQFVSSVAKTAGLDKYWLGLTDAVEEQTFVWLSGAPYNFSNFAGSEGVSRHEDCVFIRAPNTGWGDFACKGIIHIICEAPLV